MNRRGAALLTVLLLAATLGAVVASAALMTDLNLRLARQRADALAADVAVTSAAAVAEAALRSAAAAGGLPAELTLPVHGEILYRLEAYRPLLPGVAVVDLSGVGAGGALATASLEFTLSGSGAEAWLHR